MRTTLSEAAVVYGISAQGMQKKLRRHGVAPDARGTYDAARVAEAVREGALADKRGLAEAAAKAGGVEVGSIHGKKLIEQVRKLTADADTAEFRLGMLRGEHIPITEHRERVGRIVRVFRQAVDVWIATTAAECGDPVVKRRVEDARRKAFGAIAAEWEAAGGGDAAGAAGTAGAAVDAEGGAA